MTKKEAIENPNSCWNKAGDDTIVFILIDTDEAMPDAIRAWINKRLASGKNFLYDPKIVSAEEVAAAVEAKQDQRNSQG